MPLCTLHLIKLAEGTTVESYLGQLLASSSSIGKDLITASQVRKPIIEPTRIDSTFLTSTRWDLLLLFKGTASLSNFPTENMKAQYTVFCGVPGKIVDNYAKISNDLNSKPKPKLLCVDQDGKPKFSSSSTASKAKSSQNLELSDSLLSFASHLKTDLKHTGPVSMLNLLSFNSAPDSASNYHKYGQAFATVAGRRGGNAKVVGVVPNPKDAQLRDSRGDPTLSKPQDWWNEMTLVHYPSIDHFVDMSADPEYQEANVKYRLGSLKDTALICTTEIDLNQFKNKAKL